MGYSNRCSVVCLSAVLPTGPCNNFPLREKSTLFDVACFQMTLKVLFIFHFSLLVKTGKRAFIFYSLFYTDSGK